MDDDRAGKIQTGPSGIINKGIMENNRTGKIQTVLGCINPDQAGITMVHEHLHDTAEPLMAQLKKRPARFAELCDKPISWDMGWWLMHHPYSNFDNTRLYEEKDAITEEMTFYKLNGGGTIVENTTVGLQRNVQFLEKVAKDTGVNVVAGTGYYVESSRPGTTNLSMEEMATVMSNEIQNGCEGTSIKAGVIGEIGCSWPLTDSERRVVQASAHVENDLGCPVTIHPGRHERAPFEIVRVYQEAGGHVDRLVMSHMDRTIFDVPKLLEFAQLGCYMDYDLFGMETSYYQLAEELDMPSDAQRIQMIKTLVDNGHQARVTVGQDIHTKHRLMRYGGHGYSHVLLNVVPKMLIRGISAKTIDMILKENPQRWLTFK